MRAGRNLEQTPGLVDADVTDNIRSMHASIGVGTQAGRTDTGREVVHRRAVINCRIVEADGAGHAVTELGSVLDVVSAGDGIVTTEQVRRRVAWKTMPRRCIGRGRLTEGEAGKLQEKLFESRRRRRQAGSDCYQGWC